MSFPSSIDTFAGFTSTHTLQADNHAAQSNQEQAAIVAVETKIGTGASTPTSTSVLVGNGIGTSAWGQVALSSMVSGVLPVNNGGTGTGTSTGTGSVVLNNSPSITTPTLTTPTSTAMNNSSGLTTDTITTTGNASVGGTLGVTGATTLASLVLNGAISGTGLAWQTWTPVWTGSAIGNAVVTANYVQIGKTVLFDIAITLGTTSTLAVGADTTVTLPVTASSSANYIQYVSTLGTLVFLNGGFGYAGFVNYFSTTAMQLAAFVVSGASVGSGAFDTAHLPAFANGNTLGINGFYQAA